MTNLRNSLATLHGLVGDQENARANADQAHGTVSDVGRICLVESSEKETGKLVVIYLA